jgi:hypothetical protein
VPCGTARSVGSQSSTAQWQAVRPSCPSPCPALHTQGQPGGVSTGAVQCSAAGADALPAVWSSAYTDCVTGNVYTGNVYTGNVYRLCHRKRVSQHAGSWWGCASSCCSWLCPGASSLRASAGSAHYMGCCMGVWHSSLLPTASIEQTYGPHGSQCCSASPRAPTWVEKLHSPLVECGHHLLHGSAGCQRGRVS